MTVTIIDPVSRTAWDFPTEHDADAWSLGAPNAVMLRERPATKAELFALGVR